MRTPCPELRAAQANLVRLRSGATVAARIQREERAARDRAAADRQRRADAYIGMSVDELRELRKVELRIAKAADRGVAVNRGEWEEVDARIETLEEGLRGLDEAERTRCLRVYRKESKRPVPIEALRRAAR